jgi:hypothetical protein
MNCRDARDRLLESEGPDCDATLSAHLAGCAACRQLAADVAHLEDAWRSQPLPPGAERAKQAFLDRLPTLAASASRTPARPRTHRLPTSRWLIAATVLIGVGVGGALFVAMPKKASASSDVVAQLVDWNLSLARTASPAERDRIFASRAPGLGREIATAALSPEERALAVSLFETAPRLARDADPLAEADRLNELADSLLSRMSSAADRGDARRSEKYAKLYRRVAALGIEPKLSQLLEADALDFEGQRRLERLILRDADRVHTLLSLLEKAPDASQKEIRQALKIARKRRKKKGPDAAPRPGLAEPGRARKAKPPL